MTLQEIEKAITDLPREDLSEFRDWFLEFDAAIWDRKFEEDAASGRLDEMGRKAIRDYEEGHCEEL
ncbi:MAG: hypothetical protein H6752_10195 [Candidatus Omnitrophica bacterium]|nr:hypothetical protein [Candidatus Omnitrophota bacterium]